MNKKKILKKSCNGARIMVIYFSIKSCGSIIAAFGLPARDLRRLIAGRQKPIFLCALFRSMNI